MFFFKTLPRALIVIVLHYALFLHKYVQCFFYLFAVDIFLL